MSKPNVSAWQAKAQLKILVYRAQLLHRIRAFFHDRGVLEVETPSLGLATTPDPHLQSFEVHLPDGVNWAKVCYYLQTSPEFFMKRLLASGSGSIYQIGKAYRAGERGHLHQPEFTLLEWYRVGFDQHDLMQEVGALIQAVLGVSAWRKQTYQSAFYEYCGINPHTSDCESLKACADQHGLDAHWLGAGDRNGWLDYLFSQVIQPHLGHLYPLFIEGYPASQAVLARISQRQGVPIADRFELFIQGVELANGFYELKDPLEQRERFEKDNARRRQLGLPEVAMDEQFLAALPHLPDCSGVALGIDRLVLVATGFKNIQQVVSF